MCELQCSFLFQTFSKLSAVTLRISYNFSLQCENKRLLINLLFQICQAKTWLDYYLLHLRQKATWVRATLGRLNFLKMGCDKMDFHEIDLFGIRSYKLVFWTSVLYHGWAKLKSDSLRSVPDCWPPNWCSTRDRY